MGINLSSTRQNYATTRKLKIELFIDYDTVMGPKTKANPLIDT